MGLYLPKIPGQKELRKKKSLRFSKFGKGENGENQRVY
jgi:hypothetical protein